MEINKVTTKKTKSWSKSTIELLVQGMKYVQN